MIRIRTSIMWAVCVLAAGCQSNAPKASVAPIAQEDRNPREKPPAPSPIERESGIAAATDPCALRMQDLCGAMLFYFASHKQLPVKLEELQPYANTGTTLAFTCPTTGEAYVYSATGLVGSKIRDTLILYDQTAAHGGERWGIVMAPPVAGNAVLMYVIPINDKLLKAYGVTR